MEGIATAGSPSLAAELSERNSDTSQCAKAVFECISAKHLEVSQG